MDGRGSPMPLAEAFGDVAWCRDWASGEVTYLSPGADAFFGLPEGEASFERILEAVHPEDRARVAGLRLALADGIAVVDFRYYRGRELRHAETRARVVLGDDGAPVRTEGVVHDVTDRVRAERRTAAQGHRARALLSVAERLAGRRDSASVGQLLCDELVRVLPVQNVALRLVDPATDELVVTAVAGPPVRRPRPLTRASYEAVASRLGPTGYVRDVLLAPEFASEHAYFRSIGLRTLVYTTLRRADAQVFGLLAGVTMGEPVDVPEEALEVMRAIGDLGALAMTNVELIEESRRTADRYRTIVETAAEGIVLVDPAYTIRLANAQFAAMVGATVDDLVGTSAERFFPREDVELRRASYAARMAGPRGPQRARLVAVDGRVVHVLSNASALHERGEPVGLLVLVSDVTESHKLEEKLLQAQKLESLGVLAGGIAHDFNNLLVSILGNAGLALMDLPSDAPAREIVGEVQSAALRAAELTKQLLAYSGKGRFVVARVDASRVVEEMAHTLTAIVAKGVLLEFHFARGLPPIEADATQVRQLVVNLVTNSSDALVDGGGTIAISTRLVHAAREDLAETYVDDGLDGGDYVAIEVRDTGAGMSEETRARIFDPFFTTKFTGRGLGLAATLGILRAHKGAVRVESEPGRGTRITVLFPALEAAVERTPSSPPSPAAETAGGRLVLVVDDEPGVRNVARRVLERAGYRVISANDGLEGVEVFEAHAAEVAVVLLDVTMPRLGGEAAFRQIRAIRADVPVILTSGFSEQEATSRFAGQGLAGFLEKPFSPRSLLGKVHEAGR